MGDDQWSGWRRDVILGALIIGLGGALVWQMISGGDVDPTATAVLGSALTMLVQGHTSQKESSSQ